jgi:ParB/RepB/Spo0J family partition protein
MSNREGFLDKMAKARQEQAASGTSSKGMAPLNTLAARHLKAGEGELKRRAEEYVAKYGDGAALPCLNLDPSEIRVGRFFNRLPQSFDESLNVEFAELLEDINRTDGNLVSGLVRPYADKSNPKIKYELVFGERRLKACMKVGVQFKAEIADISDAEFILLHSTENRFRQQISIVESALQFKSWQEKRTDDAGKKVPTETLAAEIGYSRTHYFRLQAIGNIDEKVLFGIPKIEQLSVKETDILCKTWNSGDGRLLILERLSELTEKKLSGKAAIEHLCKPKNTSTIETSNKVSIKLPAKIPDRDSLVSKLKALGNEFGIEIIVK